MYITFPYSIRRAEKGHITQGTGQHLQNPEVQTLLTRQCWKAGRKTEFGKIGFMTTTYMVKRIDLRNIWIEDTRALDILHFAKRGTENTQQLINDK